MLIQRWPITPTAALQIQRSQIPFAGRLDALQTAINESPLQIRGNLEKLLAFAEAWLDRDILRAILVAEGDPPIGTIYILAFIREAKGVILATQWTLMPPLMVRGRPVRCLVIGTPAEIYDLAIDAGRQRGGVIGLWAEWIFDHLGQDVPPESAGEWIRTRLADMLDEKWSQWQGDQPLTTPEGGTPEPAPPSEEE